MGSDSKYGWIRGGKASFPLPMGASEVLRGKSGRFVKRDTSGRGEIAGDGHTQLIGYVEGGDETCSSSEGGTVKNCINDVGATFRIPFFYDGVTWTRNYSVALIGETCDLLVKNQIQYANITDSSEDTLVIVGGKAASAAVADGAVADVVYGDGYVDVMLNPNKMHAVGVAD